MSLFRRSHLAVGVAQGHLVQVCEPPAEAKSRRFDASADAVRSGSAARELSSSLQALFGERRGRVAFGWLPSARIVVCDEIAKHWILKPPPGVSSLNELRAVAAARFVQLFGGTGEDWSITADWRIGQPIVCAAVPRWLTQCVESACSSARVRHELTTTLGDALAIHRGAVPKDGWCCIRTPHTLAVLRLRGGLPESLRITLRLEENDMKSRLTDAAIELRRDALRCGDELDTPVTWLDLAAHSQSNVSEMVVERVPYRIVNTHHAYVRSLLPARGDDEASVAAALAWMNGALQT